MLKDPPIPKSKEIEMGPAHNSADFEYAEMLRLDGWVEVKPRQKQEGFITSIDEVEFGMTAVIKHLPVYTHVTGTGCICPSKNDISLEERRGAVGHVLRFAYNLIGGEKIFFDVVPNVTRNTADIRVVEKSFFQEDRTSPWVTLINVI